MELTSSVRLPDERPTMLPLVGRIAAGYPIEAIEIPDTVDLEEVFTSRYPVRALTVDGDSMIDEHIRDGDLVVYEERSNARNGNTVVAMVDGDEATLKKFYKEKNRIRLQPANPRYKPIYSRNVKILGVVIGVWWMTAPDPARTEDEQGITARTLARWCITAELLSSPLQMTSQGGMGFATAGTTTPAQTILMLAGLIVEIAVIVGYLAGLVYLRRLALRIPQPGLAQQTRVVTWGYGCAAVASIGVWIGMDVVSAAVSVGTAPVFGVTMTVVALGSCATAVAMLVFGVWGLVLLFLYRGALSRAAAEARATWAASG
ncbi:MAG: hypothetical protein IH804_01090 [Planctomycetes bacterium]|nr:hypothetical protein [Planctomycetota bacterium]